MIEKRLKLILTTLLGADCDLNKPLIESGLDSLKSMELLATVENEFNIFVDDLDGIEEHFKSTDSVIKFFRSVIEDD